MVDEYREKYFAEHHNEDICSQCNHLMRNHNPHYQPHWDEGISRAIECKDCPNGECWGVAISGWYFKSVGMIVYL